MATAADPAMGLRAAAGDLAARASSSRMACMVAQCNVVSYFVAAVAALSLAGFSLLPSSSRLLATNRLLMCPQLLMKHHTFPSPATLLILNLTLSFSLPTKPTWK